MEFEVTKCHSNKGPKLNPDSISLVEYKNFRETDKFNLIE